MKHFIELQNKRQALQDLTNINEDLYFLYLNGILDDKEFKETIEPILDRNINSLVREIGNIEKKYC